ncbi:unnamed protein product, partial [Ectocarpus fasciculatus]
MLSCGSGDSGVGNDVNGHGAIENARDNGKVNRTVNLMSNRRFLMFFLAVVFLGAAVMLLASAGNRARSVGSPPDRANPTGGFKASLPPWKKKSNESIPNEPGTTEGKRMPQRALEEGQSSTAFKPTINMTPADDLHPLGRVAIFVYDGVPELDHVELVQCYRNLNR